MGPLAIEPPKKRQRLIREPSVDTDSSADTFRRRHDAGRGTNSFEGHGILSSGSFNVGRDITIQTFGNGAHRDADGHKNQILLDSLRFEQMDARQMSVKKAHGRTCRWFLQSPPFVNWTRKDDRDDDHSFLWIKGKPGAGKSTLMKFLVKELQSRRRKENGNDILLTFFFNARGDDLERSTIGLYRSLLVQLLETGTDLLWVLENVRVGHIWTIESLKQISEDALQSVDDTNIVCLVDALDECDEAQIRDMVSFFSNLSTTQDRLRICFASRHYPHISIQTGLSLILENQVGHSDDITSYLTTALHIGHSNELTAKIRCELQAKASGVFMWIVLVVDILNKEYDAGREHSLLQRIHQLPKDLHDLFLDIITRQGDNSQGLLLCIQWILFSRQPLSPKQLYFALLSGLEPENLVHCHTDSLSDDSIRRYILHNSKGLAESTKSKSPRVQFIHESVRDFLLKDDGIGKIWPELSTNIPGRSHDSLKQCCLTYMEAFPIEDLSLMNKFSFLEYVNMGILHHAEQAQSEGLCQRDFLFDFPLLEWVQLHNLLEKHASRRYTPQVTLLYVLAEAGLPELIRICARPHLCFEITSERYGMPVLAACALKNTVAIHFMLEIEANGVSHFCFEEFCSKFSFTSDADTYSTSGRNFRFSRTRDRWPQLIQFGSQKVSLFYLMTRQISGNSLCLLRGEPLVCAVQNGWKMLLDELMQRGVDILGSFGAGTTPLHVAVEARKLDIVKYFIHIGADTSAINSEGLTPLFLAARNPPPFSVTRTASSEIVQVLMDHSSDDLSALYPNKRTLLHEVSRSGHVAIVKQLIGYGIDVNAVDEEGSTALAEASHNRHEETVKLLIDSGADVKDVNNKGETALHIASEYGGKIEMIKLLIDSGVDVNAMDERGSMALHMVALNRESPEVVKLLIDSGADVNAVNNKGETALHVALEYSGHVETIKLLIDSGADANAKSEEGSTALHIASRFGDHIENVKLLIDSGADVNAMDEKGSTALHTASYFAPPEVVKLLIDSGADVNAVNKNGFTALARASLRGRIGNVKLLIDYGGDVTATDGDGMTPLHHLARGADDIKVVEEIAELLVKHRASVTATDKKGQTPLHLLLSSVRYLSPGYFQSWTGFCKWLIDHGAEPTAVDSKGKTPLDHLAELERRLDVDVVTKILHDRGVSLVQSTNESGNT